MITNKPNKPNNHSTEEVEEFAEQEIELREIKPRDNDFKQFPEEFGKTMGQMIQLPFNNAQQIFAAVTKARLDLEEDEFKFRELDEFNPQKEFFEVSYLQSHIAQVCYLGVTTSKTPDGDVIAKLKSSDTNTIMIFDTNIELHNGKMVHLVFPKHSQYLQLISPNNSKHTLSNYSSQLGRELSISKILEAVGIDVDEDFDPENIDHHWFNCKNIDNYFKKDIHKNKIFYCIQNPKEGDLPDQHNKKNNSNSSKKNKKVRREAAKKDQNSSSSSSKKSKKSLKRSGKNKQSKSKKRRVISGNEEEITDILLDFAPSTFDDDDGSQFYLNTINSIGKKLKIHRLYKNNGEGNYELIKELSDINVKIGDEVYITCVAIPANDVEADDPRVAKKIYQVLLKTSTTLDELDEIKKNPTAYKYCFKKPYNRSRIMVEGKVVSEITSDDYFIQFTEVYED